MTEHKLIAVVHTTPASIPIITAALAAELPEAQVWNLVDDRLGPDAEALGEVSPQLRDRMLNLVRHGITGGADAVLMACSVYGETRAVAEKLFTVPVFSSDADMMDAIALAAPRRVAVLASLHAAAKDTTARLSTALDGVGVDEVVPVFCEGAAAAAATGDRAALVSALAAGLDAAPGHFDLVCIAQYSLSSAAHELAAKTGLSVVSPPQYAARAIAATLQST